MRKPALLAAGALALAGLLNPASAATPQLPTQELFFHCPADGVKVTNLAPITSGVASWNATKPTASVQSGAGCGFADPGGLAGTGMETIYDVPVKGTFTGNLDSLTVRFYDINVGPSRSTNSLTAALRVVIDGQSMFGMTTAATPAPAARPYTITLKPSSSGASQLAEMTVTGLGFVEKEGTPQDVEHTISIAVGGTSDALSGWVMDTSETPSSIVFNPATPAAATAQATSPGGPVPAEEE